MTGGFIFIRTVFAYLFCVCLGSAALSHETTITIGTGSVAGVYFPASNAICRLINRDRVEHGIRCKVKPTSGSLENLDALRFGELEFALVQSDLQYHAVYGSAAFEQQGRFDSLRSVLALHSEPFTVIARSDSGIRSFEDLTGQRVNIGHSGSGQHATMKVVMQAMGWEEADFAKLTEFPPSRQAKALCNNEVDAIVYAVGHPSLAVHEAMACDAIILNVDNPEVKAMVDQYEYYSMLKIPAGMYREADADVVTFGMRATLVTTADIPETVIYQITKTIFENVEQFKALHSALNDLNQEEMSREALSAKLHPGAMAYFREAGLH